jgi:predicted nucleic acid-binding protein
MGQGHLIDTNIIIDNLGNKLSDNAKNYLHTLRPIISAVTKIELLDWLNATKEQLTPLYNFIDVAHVLPIDEPVIEKTIYIKKKIALGDAIIAATALAHGFSLITRNVLDFRGIDGLAVIDPYKL